MMVEGAPAHRAGGLISHPSIVPKLCPKKTSQTMLEQELSPETHIDNFSHHRLIFGGHQPQGPFGDGHEGDRPF